MSSTSLFSHFSKWLNSVSSIVRLKRKDKNVVIFDKDGTLVDIHSQWAPWIRSIVSSIVSETDLDISDKAFTRLGFDNDTGRILPGILGEGTQTMLQDCLSSILQEEGISPFRADEVIRVSLGASINVCRITPIGDVAGLFRRLKQNGFQIAINTSDSRDMTLKTLDHLGVSNLVDAVVCGDDDWMIAKPHPVSAFMICAKLGVQPENAVMVGDSPCDVRLGTNAQLGCSIGVLTGIAGRKALEVEAHYVVSDVTMVEDLIISCMG